MEITREMKEAYRVVRRNHAEEDVRCWLVDHGCDPDEYRYFGKLVDAYERWQGDNPFWYEAIGDLKGCVEPPMRTIDSKTYAEEVEDVIWNSLKDALIGAFDYITRHMGCIEDYDERQVKAQQMAEAFDAGIAATWRDQAIELFEMYGMDIKSDGTVF